MSVQFSTRTYEPKGRWKTIPYRYQGCGKLQRKRHGLYEFTSGLNTGDSRGCSSNIGGTRGCSGLMIQGLLLSAVLKSVTHVDTCVVVVGSQDKAGEMCRHPCDRLWFCHVRG